MYYLYTAHVPHIEQARHYWKHYKELFSEHPPHGLIVMARFPHRNALP